MGITLEEDGFYYKGVRLVREDSPEYTSGREAYGGKDYCARVKLTVTADGDVALTTYSVHSGDLNSVTPDEFHQRTLYFQETEAQGTLRADSLQKMTDLIDAIEDDLKALQAGYTVKWNHKEFVGVLDANATAAYHNIQHTFARHAEAGLWYDNPVMDASE